MTNRPMVIYIVSTARSGSTLLGSVLGSHSSGMYIGEVVSPLAKGKPISCRVCRDQVCPIWGTVLEPAYLNDLYQEFNVFRHGAPREPVKATLFSKLFSAFPASRFIVDSSKNIPWISFSEHSEEYDQKIILLRRDLRAVWAAYHRDGKKVDRDKIAGVVRKIHRIHAFEQEMPSESCITLRYEDLVTQPAEQIAQLCEVLGLAYEPSMLRFYDSVHHVIGGNPGLVDQHYEAVGKAMATHHVPERVYYQPDSPGFGLDDRWREEMTTEQRSQFEDVMGALNRQWGYGE